MSEPYTRLVIIGMHADGTFDHAAIHQSQVLAGKLYDLDPRAIYAGDEASLAPYLGQLGAAAISALSARDATISASGQQITSLTAERDAASARITELEAQLALSQADDLPAAIRAERDRRILAGVHVGDHWYHSDMQMQIQVLGMVIMGANLPAGTMLKTLDDGPQPATPQIVQQLFGATAQQMAQLHAIADAAIAAGTPLDAIQWPPIYTPA